MNPETGRPLRAIIHRSAEIFRAAIFPSRPRTSPFPNGRRTEMAMVRHPGSVGVVPLLGDGSVLMEYQYRHCIRDYLLEIPAGTLEPGELPLSCARRELLEETGIRPQSSSNSAGPISCRPTPTRSFTCSSHAALLPLVRTSTRTKSSAPGTSRSRGLMAMIAAGRSPTR